MKPGLPRGVLYSLLFSIAPWGGVVWLAMGPGDLAGAVVIAFLTAFGAACLAIFMLVLHLDEQRSQARDIAGLWSAVDQHDVELGDLRQSLGKTNEHLIDLGAYITDGGARRLRIVPEQRTPGGES